MDDKKFNYNEYYNRIASQYNEIRLDSKNDFDTTIKFIIDHTDPSKRHLLDVGCGTGKYGEKLMEYGYDVKGLDKSLAQVEQAQKVITAQIGNVVSLPFKTESFDVCTMIMMIHHLSNEDRTMAFSEVHRVLKKGGRLIIKTASHEDLMHRISSRFFPEALQIDIKRYPSIEILRYELSNFREVHTEHIVSVTSFQKDDMIQKLLKRRTSNLGMLSEEELKKGINRFVNEYQNQQLIKKENHCTFIVALK